MYNHALENYICPFCLLAQGIENGETEGRRYMSITKFFGQKPLLELSNEHLLFCLRAQINRIQQFHEC